METLQLRDHKIFVSQSELKLHDLKGGEVKMVPAEVEEARELVGVVWKMTSLPAMPNTMKSSHETFTVNITGKDVELKRSEDLSGNIGFRFPISECDWVIDAMDMGLKKLKDLFELSPQPRGVSGFVPDGDYTTDLFEGRS